MLLLLLLLLLLSEMYAGFQIWGSSGPLFEKFGGPLQNFGVQLINIQEIIFDL